MLVGLVNRRLLIGALCIITAALALALWCAQPHGSLAVWWNPHWPYLRHLLARKGATAIQAVGALIAFYGLARAYLRAKYDLRVWQWAKRGVARLAGRVDRLWRALLRKPLDATVHVGRASASYAWMPSPAVGVSNAVVDFTLPLQEQIKRLTEYVNKKAEQAAEMQGNIARLQRDLEKARDKTSELKRETWAHIETQIQQLNDRLNNIQALDLTWAIWGLFITFVGTVLSLWA
ncbi:hypothetical protein A5747_03435 [Mycobacterium sp. IS-836]|uniref:hypothetical protein n=1 Tax=Mycobacterium sp. IS-836 TaxID=1834160 RepID=UPI00096E9D8C|nr:hypothetical protein [Mycobacterium sp. IS-836]OMC57429.1 hypothetical protein A5747_03435 [Mycobacterium sp. IS-836]